MKALAPGPLASTPTADGDDDTRQEAKSTRAHGPTLESVKPSELKGALERSLVPHESDTEAPEGRTPPRGIAAHLTPARPRRGYGARPVRRQVELILASVDFDASRRSKEFLRFVVEETLAGRGDELSQSVIAIRVFGRQDDFDAVVDPIVRIQAGRLRRSLERYYLLSGRHDPVRIDLPRGTYVPAFGAQAEREPPEISDHPPELGSQSLPADEWPWVVIRPFEAAPLGPEHEMSTVRVTEGLVLELGRYRDVRVVLEQERDQPARPGQKPARFSLGGRLWPEGGDLRVTAHLVDRETGEQVWGDEYHTTPGAGRWSGSTEDIARVIAARVGGEEGVVVQLLAAERRKSNAASITTHGAILLSYDFFLARDASSVPTALEALRKAVKAEPDCGLAWTRLARLCVANHAFEITPIATPIDEAIACAHQAVRVDPASRRARCILASALLVKGELTAARDELEQALRLTPDSLVYLEIIGFLLSLLGDGERGPALIRQAQARNPHCLPHAAFGLWFDHMRRGEIEAAHQAAVEYREPAFFWRGAMRACCLGLLGRTAEAEDAAGELRRRKPDFDVRGRRLIGHYVKLPAVMDRVVDGLAKAGLKLD